MNAGRPLEPARLEVDGGPQRRGRKALGMGDGAEVRAAALPGLLRLVGLRREQVVVRRVEVRDRAVLGRAVLAGMLAVVAAGDFLCTQQGVISRVTSDGSRESNVVRERREEDKGR